MNEARISFEGNIGSEPEIKFLPSGQAVCEFSVAVNQRKKVGEEWKDTNTSWFRVASWGKLAESAVELKKGSRVLVVGTLIAQEWEKDGKSGLTLKVTAEQIGSALVLMRSGAIPTRGASEERDDPWAKSIPDDSPPF